MKFTATRFGERRSMLIEALSLDILPLLEKDLRDGLLRIDTREGKKGPANFDIVLTWDSIPKEHFVKLANTISSSSSCVLLHCEEMKSKEFHFLGLFTKLEL